MDLEKSCQDCWAGSAFCGWFSSSGRPRLSHCSCEPLSLLARAWGPQVSVKHLLLILTDGSLCSQPSVSHWLSSSSVLKLSLWSPPQLPGSVPTHSLHSGQRTSLKRPAWWVCPRRKALGCLDADPRRLRVYPRFSLQCWASPPACCSGTSSRLAGSLL